LLTILFFCFLNHSWALWWACISIWIFYFLLPSIISSM